jgi:putative lipase involved disintegration of autophagic bodies
LGYKNILADMDAYLVTFPYCNNCYAHRGFVRTYSSLKNDFLDSLKTLIYKYPQAELIITGYSLGAAIASYAYADVFNIIKKSVKAFYTYGMPRSGNS